jgi:hypothetical protein
LSKIKEQEWADKKNIFLMGFSEGGMASHRVTDPGFAGVIMSGFPCALNGPIKSPTNTPTLVLNWTVEPDFILNNGLVRKQCSEKPFWKFRSKSTEVLLDGKGHFNADDPLARDAVFKFLTENSKQ